MRHKPSERIERRERTKRREGRVGMALAYQQRNMATVIVNTPRCDAEASSPSKQNSNSREAWAITRLKALCCLSKYCQQRNMATVIVNTPRCDAEASLSSKQNSNSREAWAIEGLKV
ncbi:hypothetical protein J6590_016120 [Homalodisca vitripennis]|nr:hypothetical protein J6590_016120 [Homalodisca vitripennis]